MSSLALPNHVTSNASHQSQIANGFSVKAHHAATLNGKPVTHVVYQKNLSLMRRLSPTSWGVKRVVAQYFDDPHRSGVDRADWQSIGLDLDHTHSASGLSGRLTTYAIDDKENKYIIRSLPSGTLLVILLPEGKKEQGIAIRVWNQKTREALPPAQHQEVGRALLGLYLNLKREEGRGDYEALMNSEDIVGRLQESLHRQTTAQALAFERGLELAIDNPIS